MIGLCGRVTIVHAGHDLGPALPGRQGRTLFAYLLAHRDRGCPRRELIEAIWGGDPPAASDSALSALLSKLRKVLGADAIQGRSELRLTLGGEVDVDVDRADREVAAAEQAVAQEDWAGALVHARACLDTDCTAFLPDGDGDWVWERRRELDTVRVRALEVVALAGVRGAAGDLGSAEQSARAAVVSAPFRESAHRRLMEVHEAAGNPAEALRVFEELRTRLRDDLGTAPGPESIALHGRLLRGERLPAVPVPASVAGPRGMPPTLAAAHVRSTFVGRGRELRELHELWDAAGAGRRCLALLAGDTGIGKTGLAAEFAARVHSGGGRVLYGRCDAESVGPYQPIAEMLRTAGEGVPLGELAGPEPVEPQALRADLDTRRLRFFDAVSDLVAGLGALEPVLVVLDDLHWADRPTLQLVRHLVRTPAPERMLVLGTYRDTEIEDDHPLHELVDDQRREGALERLVVGGLERSDVERMVVALAGEAPAAFVNALHDETEGNPFFIEEVVRHQRETGATFDLSRSGVPEGVREVTARRLRRLGESARRTMQTAAIVGREFDFEVLECVGPARGETLVAALEEAAAARVIREDGERAGRFSFAHVLFRAVLYESVSSLRRARLHGRIGEALVGLHGEASETHLSAVAHHFARAADVEQPERALEFSVRAGRHAARLMAWEDAAGHYAAALHAGRRMPDSATDERARCELTLALGTAQQRAGLPQARETHAQALAAAHKLADPELLARAALGIAGQWTVLGDVRADVVAVLEEALEVIGDEETPLRARVLARLAFESYYARDESRRLELSGQAVSLARRTGDLATLAVCLDARHYALWRPETVDERLAVAAELSSTAQRVGDRELELEGAGWSVVDLLEVGDMVAVDEQIELASRLAEDAGQPLYLWWTAVFRAMRAQLAGDFLRAEALALTALEIGRRGQAENAVHYFAQQIFLNRRAQGRLAEVEDGVRNLIERYPAIPAWRGVLALALVETGRTAEAREVYEDCMAGGIAALPRDANWLIAATLLAEVCGALGDVPRAPVLYEALEPYARRNVVVGRAATCNGSASRLLGILAGTMGDLVAARGHFSDALAMHERMGAPAWTAYTLVAEAEALRETDPVRAGAAVAEAVGSCDELGLVALGVRARSLL